MRSSVSVAIFTMPKVAMKPMKVAKKGKKATVPAPAMKPMKAMKAVKRDQSKATRKLYVQF